MDVSSTRSSPLVRSLAVAVALYLSVSPVSAQTAQITGVVRDASAAAIPDATVRLTQVGRGTVTSATTNAVGVYAITFLAPATYTVEAVAPGFTATILTAVLRTGQTLQLDVSLNIAGLSEAVEVRDSVLMEKASGAVSTVVDRTFAANIPLNGRGFSTLLLLTPGVAPTTGGYSVNGSRENQNQYNVDGVSANFGVYTTATLAGSAAGGFAPFSSIGGTNTLLSTDALEEFTVQTSTYAPEFGRTPGGQIQITSRSGAERFHGSVFDYLRNSAFDANNWFNNRNGIKKPLMRQNDFGGTVGGPLFRRRTFFFYSYEGLRLAQPATVNGFVPSRELRANAPAAVQFMLNTFPQQTGPSQPNGLAPYVASNPQTNTVNATSLRIDQRLSDRLSLFGRYLHSPSSSDTRGISTRSTGSFGTDQVTAGLTWTATSSLAHDLRVSYAVASSRVDIGPLDVNGAVIPPYSSFFLNREPENNNMTMSLAFGGGTILWGKNNNNVQRQINIVDSVTLVKGNHLFKVGFDYRHLSPSRRPPEAIYQTTFTTVDSLLNGTPSSQTVSSRATNNLYFNQYAAYFQDSWRIAAPLVLTYGLRWDVAPPPVFTDGPPLMPVTQVEDPSQMALAPSGTPLYRTDYRNFAPRVGFAYDVSRKENWGTVVRGGAGLFWDVQQAAVGISLGSTPPAQATAVYANAQYPLPAAQQTPPSIALAPPFTNFQAFDPDLPTPYVRQYNLAVEHQLGRTHSLNINYVGSSGRNLARQSALGNVNPAFLLQTLFNLNDARSNYNALQVKFQRQLSGGFRVLTQYTWSKSLDHVSTENGTLWTAPVRGYRAEQDHGPSSFDMRHQFSVAGTYLTTADRLGRIPSMVLKEWSIAPLVRIQSALPVHVYYTTAISGVTQFLRPDRVADQPLYLYGSAYPGGRAINPAAFAVHTTPGTTFDTLRQGTAGRNSVRGFGLATFDVSLGRRFPVRESVGVEARLDVFNVFNNPNFGQPSGVFNAAGFGVSTSAFNQTAGGLNAPIALYQSGGARSMQLSLKLLF